MGSKVVADKRKVAEMREWIKRRQNRGMEPSADVIWDKIKERWSYSTQEEWEAIFQELK